MRTCISVRASLSVHPATPACTISLMRATAGCPVLAALSCLPTHPGRHVRLVWETNRQLLGPSPGRSAGETLPNAHVRDLGGLLKENGYEVFLKSGSLYGFKGISGRFAPIAVHVSLILILFGAAVGALGGLDGQVRPPPASPPCRTPAAH